MYKRWGVVALVLLFLAIWQLGLQYLYDGLRHGLSPWRIATYHIFRTTFIIASAVVCMLAVRRGTFLTIPEMIVVGVPSAYLAFYSLLAPFYSPVLARMLGEPLQAPLASVGGVMVGYAIVSAIVGRKR